MMGQRLRIAWSFHLTKGRVSAVSMRRSLLVACCLTWMSLSSGRAEDWPEFRGPGKQGHSSETGLPTTWSETENVRWKSPVPGNGWSSPIVVADRIYLTTAVPTDETAEKSDLSLRTLCYNATTGEQIWNTEVFLEVAATAPGIHQKNSHASPTPILEGDRLYVHFGHEGTACLDLDGNIIWSTNELRYPPVHGGGPSPVIWRDRLILTCDGGEGAFVAAISKDKGELLWKHERGIPAPKTFSFCTPLIINVAGQDQVIVPGANVVSALDPETGVPIWSYTYEGYSVVPRPLFAHGLIYISTGYDVPKILAIRPDGTGDVTATHLAWEFDKNAPNTPSMLVIGNELYMVSDNGVASCLDALTGERHWQKRLGGNFSSSLLFADGKIYLPDESGKTTVIAPGTEYEELAANTLNERLLASFATAPGALFIRTEGNLYRIEASK
jgi:outer membrane protein assembly factor BamB